MLARASSLLASWMIGQISASNQLRTRSELAPNMFGASSELASVMEFGFYKAPVTRAQRRRTIQCQSVTEKTK